MTSGRVTRKIAWVRKCIMLAMWFPGEVVRPGQVMNLSVLLDFGIEVVKKCWNVVRTHFAGNTMSISTPQAGLVFPVPSRLS